MAVQAFCTPCGDVPQWQILVNGVWVDTNDFVEVSPDFWEYQPATPSTEPVTARYCCPDGCSDPAVFNATGMPSISLIKQAVCPDGVAAVGGIIGYTFTITNTGNVDLSNITITDPGATVAGNIGLLAAGQTDSTSITGGYVLTQADIDAGIKTNIATVSGSYNGVMVTNSSTATCMFLQAPMCAPIVDVPATYPIGGL